MAELQQQQQFLKNTAINCSSAIKTAVRVYPRYRESWNSRSFFIIQSTPALPVILRNTKIQKTTHRSHGGVLCDTARIQHKIIQLILSTLLRITFISLLWRGVPLNNPIPVIVGKFSQPPPLKISPEVSVGHVTCMSVLVRC